MIFCPGPERLPSWSDTSRLRAKRLQRPHGRSAGVLWSLRWRYVQVPDTGTSQGTSCSLTKRNMLAMWMWRRLFSSGTLNSKSVKNLPDIGMTSLTRATVISQVLLFTGLLAAWHEGVPILPHLQRKHWYLSEVDGGRTHHRHSGNFNKGKQNLGCPPHLVSSAHLLLF